MVDEVLAGTGAIGTHREIERPARNQRRRPRAGSAAADLWIARTDYAAIAEASPKMPLEKSWRLALATGIAPVSISRCVTVAFLVGAGPYPR